MSDAPPPSIARPLADAAVRAALSGGEAIMDVYQSEDFDVEAKGDGSPLTRADRMAHSCITAALQRTAVPILSEEGKSIPYEERQGWQRFWLVDPLDGTKEFIKRNGEFTVNVALIDDDSPTLGVVYAPARRKLYVGVGSGGSFVLSDVPKGTTNLSLNDVLTTGKRLPLASKDRPFRVVGSRSHLSEETEAYVEGLRKEYPDLEMASIGSSLKLCMVAEGDADVYPRFGPTMEWDTAAAHAVALGAKKRVLRYEPDKGVTGPLVYNKPDLLNPWFIVQS